MELKTKLEEKEIKCLRILTAHIRDIDCYQDPEDIKSDLHNIAEQIYNLTLE